MRHFDLCVIGSGSGNSLIDQRFADLDIALVEKGVFGGTCLNVGCIPTKMFVYPADLAHSPETGARLGVDLQLNQVRWAEIRDRIFGRIDSISAGGQTWRTKSDNVTVFAGEAHFTGPCTLDTGTGEVVTADRFVIAAGSRVAVPQVAGSEDVLVHTSDTVMRLDSLPQSMIILGGGYVAAEFAHVFSAYGTHVTIINRSGALLRAEDSDISARFTELIAERMTVRLNEHLARFEALPDGRVQVCTVDAAGLPQRYETDVLLAATGRVPNGDTLNLSATGVEADADGYVVVDGQQRTTNHDIYALGDVSSDQQLKHVANHEMRVVQHNLLHPDEMITHDHRFIPHAVFSEPQVASVGLTEAQAIEQDMHFVQVIQEYGSVAYGWAMEDTRHFAKLLADPDTGQLLGAHIVGYQASVLIQPLIQAMSCGLSAQQMAHDQYWIHPALPELIENALLALPLTHPATPH